MSDKSLTSSVADLTYQRAIELLIRLFKQAQDAGGGDGSAASLATAGKDARPSVRMINVANISTRGIVFFAHHMSGKGQQMEQNPRAALCFHWPAHHQQVNVEGGVVVLPDDDANSAWGHGPRESGLGHWASNQVGATEQESGLKERLSKFKQQFNFERVPRPPDWYGYEIQPDRIEFWKTGWGRLQSRIRFQRNDSGIWTESQINP